MDDLSEHCVSLCFYSQLLQFQKAGMFTVGAAARPCAQLHYGLTEKHRRKVRTLKKLCKHKEHLNVFLVILL